MSDESDSLFTSLANRVKQLRKSGSRAAGGASSMRKGDIIDEQYVVERVLSDRRGSEVLLVRDRNADRLAALKLLPISLSEDERAMQRFQEETRAVSLLGHENIAFVTGFGRSRDLGQFCVTEYLNGEPLAARLASVGPLPVENVLDLAAGAGSALASAHDLGLAHCDVRPGNFVSHRIGEGREEWKLLGFGISAALLRDLEPRVALYVAPEVAVGGISGPHADQFSLAATLYHALYGTPPWPDRTWETSVSGVWSEPASGSGAPGPMREVLLQALAPAAEARFSDMDGFIAAFQRASGLSRPASASPEATYRATKEGSSLTVGVSYSQPGGIGSPSKTGVPAPSVEISYGQFQDMRLVLRLKFKSANRLRREWRRNLVAGGIFVPIEREINAGSPVIVEIEFEPTGTVASFPGRVARRETEGVKGLAVDIDPSHREALIQFVEELQLVVFEASAVVQRQPQPPVVMELTVDEEFVLSRLSDADSVGKLRRTFMNLPIPLDDIIARLAEKGWIRVLGTSKRVANTEARPTAPAEANVSLVLRRVDYLNGQGNYPAAIETLALAAERYREPVLYHQLGILRLRHQSDLPGAIAAMKKAVALAPGDATYQSTLESFERFAEYDPEGDGKHP